MSKFHEDIVLQEFLAEKLPTEQLPHIFCLYARLSQNISILAPLKYAKDLQRRYLESDFKE